MRTTTGFTDLPPLPFDYRKGVIGGRTLPGGLRQPAHGRGQLGWRYGHERHRHAGVAEQGRPLWAVDLQSIPFAGRSGQVLSMDYNLMYNQSKTPNGDASKRAQWQQEATNTYLAGFTRAYEGNRRR